MADVVGIVALAGREPMLNESLGGVTLLDRAIDLIAPLCSMVVLVDTTIPASDQRSRPGTTTVVLPRDADHLTGLLAGADRVLVHDPLCPLVPAAFVRDLVQRPAEAVWVGARPVVDTVKATEAAVITGTVDREELRVVCSPIVMPSAWWGQSSALADALDDFGAMVATLRASLRVELVPAPSSSRRIEDSSGLLLMSSIDAVGHRTRER